MKVSPLVSDMDALDKVGSRSSSVVLSMQLGVAGLAVAVALLGTVYKKAYPPCCLGRRGAYHPIDLLYTAAVLLFGFQIVDFHSDLDFVEPVDHGGAP